MVWIEALFRMGHGVESPPPDFGPDRVGIDVTLELARGASHLITMGCGDACPHVPGLHRADWPLEDPKAKPVEVVRRIRDDVRARVVALIARSGWTKS